MISFRQHGPVKIAAVFAAFGLLWVFGSDQFLAALASSPDAYQEWQTYKGTVFVLGGSGLVYLLVRWFQQEEDALIERLEVSQARLQRAQRVADMGSWDLDLETGDLTWSEQIYRIFGTSPDEADPDYETFLAFVHPEDRERIADAQEAARFGRAPLDIEHRIIRPDGQVRWVREQGRLVHEDGEAVTLTGTVQDVTDRKALEDQLRYRALHDPLTELPNRALFDDRLRTSLKAARRADRRLTLLILDLRQFKKINDSLGHTRGDRVLQEVARRLAGAVRESDTVARVGGDEFALILEAPAGRDSIVRTIDRIDALLAEPFVIGGERVKLDARIGVARYEPSSEEVHAAPDSGEELFRYANVALHRAKEKGEHHLFSADTDLALTGQIQRERRLRRAIDREEFEAHYQPVVKLATGEIVGLEALARWRHPDRGLLGPDEFIPLAEESGLIQPLGRILLRQACRELAGWERAGRVQRPLLLSVNLSARQLDEEELVPAVLEILDAESLDPRRLQLEITETTILRAYHNVAPLRDRGIQIAIDDFGTGYASFTYLRELDVDTLKLDISFVQGVESDEKDRAICQTVADLAKAFGLSAVAEGIETPGQLAVLREMDCAMGQGYLLARPAPAAEILPLLEEGAIGMAS